MNKKISDLLESINSMGGDPIYVLDELNTSLLIKNSKSKRITSCLSCVSQSACMVNSLLVELTQLPEIITKNNEKMFESEIFSNAALKCKHFLPIQDDLFNK